MFFAGVVKRTQQSLHVNVQTLKEHGGCKDEAIASHWYSLAEKQKC